MSNYLLLDIGNSRLKWAYTESGIWKKRGVFGSADLPAMHLAFADLPVPDRILVSNVAGEAIALHIQDISSSWNRSVEFLSARPEQCGVRNNYNQPEQLGTDRWAALIAAWQRVGAACLVVNCGTATTVDVLSDTGEFLGGLILPGLEMMRYSLVAQTNMSGIGLGSWHAFPVSTADAICSGAIQATVGAVRQQFELLEDAAAPCVLGGGAANILQPHLHLRVLEMNDMVLQGIQLIGQDTEA